MNSSRKGVASVGRATGPGGGQPAGPGVAIAAVGLSLIAVCYGLARFAYGLFVPVLRDEFGLDRATAGAIAASSYVGYCGAIVAAMVLTARWGARPVAAIAGLTATVGTGLIAAAPTTQALAIGVVIAGSSTGLASPPLADAVARGVRAVRRDRVQTVVNAGTGLGVMTSGPVALMVQESWRLAWWIFAAVAAVVTLWTALTLPARRGSPCDGHGSRFPPSLLPAGVGRLLAAATLMGLASSAVWTFGRDIAVTTGGVSLQASTIMWIVLGGAGLLGACAGDIVGRIGLSSGWTAGMLALACATACFALASSSYPLLLIGAATFGAVYIALTGVLLLWGTYAYSASPAFGVGAAFLLIAAGQAIGSLVIGNLVDLAGQRTAFLAAAAVAATAASLTPGSFAAPVDSG